MKNEIGLDGIDFVEFVSPEPEKLHRLFLEFGFSKTKKHKTLAIDYYEQNDIRFLLNNQPDSFAAKFGKIHGPSLCSMGWRTKDPQAAHKLALKRGAKDAPENDFGMKTVVKGIGDSLIYLVPAVDPKKLATDMGFVDLPKPEGKGEKGFITIDHLTNNVEKGTMEKWSQFYKTIFEFTEIRYFDIRGAKTGLTSYALKSPCEKFCIPINEADEAKSQINEYIQEYNGPGVQHLAFATTDILKSLKNLEGTSIQTLDIDDEYYKDVFKRIPNVTEDQKLIRKYNVLVDGDDEGYLLQLFTKNLIGPIFIEIIQRKNHFAFGEGNFGALFRSIERDQMKRGVL